MRFELKDSFGHLIPKEDLYVPHYVKNAKSARSGFFATGAVIAAGAKSEKSL